MATSGQLNTNVTYDSYFWVKWSQNSQSIANNQTIIAWSCGVYCGHEFYLNAIKMSAVSINGTQVYGGGTYSNYGKGNHTIASGTLTITHTSDGSKSFSISAFTGWLYSNHNYSSSGGSYTLTTIPRISKPTVSVSTLDFGKSVTIHTNRKSTSFVHRLWYKYLNSGWIEITPNASVTDSYSWTVPLTLMNQIPVASSLSITIGCDTYYNGSIIGEDYAYITATVPSTVVPTIGEFVFERDGNEPSSWPYTQGVTSGTIVARNLLGAYGSTIIDRKLTYKGVTYNSAALIVRNFSEAGTFTVTIKITDSRGRSAQKDLTLNVTAYSKPKLSVTAFRSNASGVEDSTGEYISVKATASVTAVGDNALQSLILQYKRHSASSYTSVALTSGTAKVIAASSDYTWDWIVTASDKVHSSDSVGSVGTGEVVLDILANGKGLGLGKVAEKEGLDSAWDFMKNGVAQVDYVIEQGTSGIWIYRKWASGLAECWGVTDAITQTTSTDWNVMTSNTGTPAINYPFTFVNPPVVSPSVYIHNGNFWLVTYNAGSTTQTPTYQIARGKSATTVTFKLGFHVFGNWK